ncbi:DUF4843 domain-containing protein [Sinomicrobium soli]|uniref:DUF4843 domain-containing protein n=1 Tax=Sinomicrobium sp. N-1-3-6 TaxID=2219864 RepID=UPI000DCB9405|nr:DUF4843 domain-containing protein [Sinomicrobium sp. N-1-3-6]RAV28943.1 hypothetical protein DN748_11160 [Sinomicrobium sp. N-1-3-6]
MKNIFSYITVVCTVTTILLTACSKDEINTYEGKDSIYFKWTVDSIFSGSTVEGIDSIGFSFGFFPPEAVEYVYKIPVYVQGELSETDRLIQVEVLETSTAVAGTHFSIPETVTFRANSRKDSIPVTLYRTPDMKEEVFSIVLEILPNKDFNTEMDGDIIDAATGEMRSYTRFELTVNDILETPEYWFEPYLGKFTIKKMTLMSELLNIPFDYYNSNRPSLPETQYHGLFMQRYLDEKKAAGETIYEEDGTEMTM